MRRSLRPTLLRPSSWEPSPCSRRSGPAGARRGGERRWHARHLARSRGRRARRAVRRCQVQLTIASNGEADGFRAPEFKGLRVLSRAAVEPVDPDADGRRPDDVIQNVYTWSYELGDPAGRRRVRSRSAARACASAAARSSSNTVTVRVGVAGVVGGRTRAAAAATRRVSWVRSLRRRAAALGPAGVVRGEDPPSSASSPTSSRAFVGPSSVIVDLVALHDAASGSMQVRHRHRGAHRRLLERVTSPRQNPKRPLSPTRPRRSGGASFRSRRLYTRALFPLREGKLTVTPVEAEASRRSTSSARRCAASASRPRP